MTTNETQWIIKQFIQNLEKSIQIGIDEDISPNEPEYDKFKEKSFKDGIECVIERLFRLEQEHRD